MNVLLTGTRHFVALGVARRLHKSGNTVFSADSIDFDYTGFSLAVKKRFPMPSVRFAEQKYIEELIRIIQEHKIDKLMPLGEEIFYIARNMEAIKAVRPKIIAEVDDIEKLDTLHNKESFLDLTLSLKLNTPNSIIITSVDEIIKYQKQTNSNIVVKPIYSRFADRFLHFEDTGQTKKYFSDKPINERYILQDFIEGKNISSFSVGSDGEVITYQSDVEMNKPGAMSSVTKISTPEIIYIADKAIRRALGFKYQLGLDFIQTPTGELFLLEANPRATIGRLLLDSKHAQFRIMAFHQFINGIISKETYPQFFKNLFFYPDAVSKWSDPLPVLVSQIGCVGLPSYLRFRKQHPGASFQAYSTYDMEYNGTGLSYQVESVGESDSEKVLELLEELSTKKSFHLIQTRRPNPIQSFSSDGQKVTIAAIKQRGEIAYLCVCAENRYFISQKSTPVGYLSSLRKNPSFPYQIDWREMLNDYLKEQHKGARVFFHAIMASNKHAIKSLTKPSDTLPSAQLACKYKTFIVNAKRFKRRELPDDVTFSRLADKDINTALSFLKGEGKKRDLFPEIASLHDNYLGATTKNCYVIRQNNEIVGFASILNQSHKKQVVVKRYAKWLSAIRTPFNMLARPMRLIYMPAEGDSISCPTVSLCIVKGNDPDLYDLFLCQLSSEIRKKSGIFTISISLDDPCIKTPDTYWNLSINYNLYVTSLSGESIKLKNIYVDGAIL